MFPNWITEISTNVNIFNDRIVFSFHFEVSMTIVHFSSRGYFPFLKIPHTYCTLNLLNPWTTAYEQFTLDLQSNSVLEYQFYFFKVLRKGQLIRKKKWNKKITHSERDLLWQIIHIYIFKSWSYWKWSSFTLLINSRNILNGICSMSIPSLTGLGPDVFLNFIFLDFKIFVWIGDILG